MSSDLWKASSVFQIWTRMYSEIWNFVECEISTIAQSESREISLVQSTTEILHSEWMSLIMMKKAGVVSKEDIKRI